MTSRATASQFDSLPDVNLYACPNAQESKLPPWRPYIKRAVRRETSEVGTGLRNKAGTIWQHQYLRDHHHRHQNPVRLAR